MSSQGETMGDQTNGGDANKKVGDGATQINQPPALARGTGKRSRAWEEFTQSANDSNEVKDKCSYCETFHLNSDSEDDEMGLVNWEFDQDTLTKALACMIITEELPFKFVEGIGFRRLMFSAQPEYEIPSRWDIARECIRIYLDEKVKLKDYLLHKKPRVCLTTDTWTSIQEEKYMCITAHFIDDTWTLRKKVLNFIPIYGFEGRDIGMEIEKCLLEWGIERVFTITLDSDGSNDAAILYLQENIMNWGHSIMKCQFLHVRCVMHIVNSMATDGLKEIGSSVRKIREAVLFIKQSPLRMRKLKKICEDEKIQSKQILCLDVSTRWNSTYMMLKTAQKFETAFKSFEYKDPYFRSDLEDGEGVPEIEDWENVRRMLMILDPFHDLTLRTSDSLSMTSNSCFREIYIICRFLDELRKSDDRELASMANKMKEKYDEHWGDPEKINKLFYLAVVLDPRYKLCWVQFALSKMYMHAVGEQLGMHIKEVLISLYNEYRQNVSLSVQLEREPSHDSQDFHDDDGPVAKVRKLLDIEEQIFMAKCLDREISRTEVDRYLDEGIEIRKDDFDVLEWWKLNSHRFPILSLLAKDVLAVPISTSGGRVLNSFRSSLTPNVVQFLICAQDWLKQSLQHPVEEGNDDVLKIELDLQKIALEPSVDIL